MLYCLYFLPSVGFLEFLNSTDEELAHTFVHTGLGAHFHGDPSLPQFGFFDNPGSSLPLQNLGGLHIAAGILPPHCELKRILKKKPGCLELTSSCLSSLRDHTILSSACLDCSQCFLTTIIILCILYSF